MQRARTLPNLHDTPAQQVLLKLADIEPTPDEYDAYDELVEKACARSGVDLMSVLKYAVFNKQQAPFFELVGRHMVKVEPFEVCGVLPCLQPLRLGLIASNHRDFLFIDEKCSSCKSWLKKLVRGVVQFPHAYNPQFFIDVGVSHELLTFVLSETIICETSKRIALEAISSATGLSVVHVFKNIGICTGHRGICMKCRRVVTEMIKEKNKYLETHLN